MWKDRWSSKPILMTGYTNQQHGSEFSLKSSPWNRQPPQPLAFPRRCPLHPRRLRQVCTFVLSDCCTAAERVWDLSGIFMGRLGVSCSDWFQLKMCWWFSWGIDPVIPLSTGLSCSRVSSGFDQIAVSRPEPRQFSWNLSSASFKASSA